MAMELSNILSHIATVHNSINSKVITNLSLDEKIRTSENYQNLSVGAILSCST
jgi:hypothetical protein